MNISVLGKSDNISREETVQVIEFFGSILLPKKIYNNIDVSIHVNNMKRSQVKNCHAFCEIILIDCYFIAVDKHSDYETIIQHLAHEMMHVQQYSTGKLIDSDTKTKNRTWWRNRYVDWSKVPYLKLPWEIDANKNEIILAELYHFEFGEK